eukprot:COSAG05_NODE_1879_length_3911_cov_4.160283_3_plen_110_part_00
MFLTRKLKLEMTGFCRTLFLKNAIFLINSDLCCSSSLVGRNAGILVADNVDTVNALHTPPGEASDLDFYAPENFVAFYEPGYLSGIAYTFLGVNAVVTWLKTLKYLLSR